MFRKDGMESLAKTEDWAETVVARTASLNGCLKSDGVIRIYGAFEGEIESTGTVIVGKAAKIVANISGRDVAVAGTVIGNISAYGRIEIYEGGRVLGDIASNSLKIEDGALFSGQSSMKPQEPETLLLQDPRQRQSRLGGEPDKD